MTSKLEKKQPLPLLVRVLNPVSSYYYHCSGETRRAFRNLSAILLFSVLVCGSVLAATLCEFCFDRDYRYFPLVLIPAVLIYYFIDKPIVFSNNSLSTVSLRRTRIFIAVIFSLLNSFLVDSFFFARDIAAARKIEIKREEDRIRSAYREQTAAMMIERKAMLFDIDKLNGSLSARRDSLDAEANGYSVSGKRGTAEIWHSKYVNYLADSTDKASQIALKKKEISGIDSSLNAQQAALNQELASVPERVSEGINKNMELLHKVVFLEGNFTNILMAIIWLLVTMILELIPLLSKRFYNLSEYFTYCGHQMDLQDKETVIIKNKELNLIGRRAVNTFKSEEFRITNEFYLDKVEAAVQYNKSIHEAAVAEMERLEALDEKLRKRYPAYYNSHIRPLMGRSYENLHKTVSEALAQ